MLESTQIILSSPTWSLNGVNIFSAQLVRGLRQRGLRARILLTHPHAPDSKPMPAPTDALIEHLPIGPWAGWRTRWRVVTRYLEEHAPCIYLPNYDFYHASIIPLLSDNVSVVGILHSDDEQYYEHARRMGRYWNAAVAVSSVIAQKTLAATPALAPRLTTIPYGVSIPQSPPKNRNTSAFLRILYAGRLEQSQKRILDLPDIMAALHARTVPATLTIAGDGPARKTLQQACIAHDLPASSVRYLGVLPHKKVLRLFEQHDVFILPSAYEGLPLALLEAMSRGCVPVVSDVPSGVSELIEHGVNGFRAPVGRVQVFADLLERLYKSPARRNAMAQNAYRRIREGNFTLEKMISHYLELFQHIEKERGSHTFHRSPGEIQPPPSFSWREHIPMPLRRVYQKTTRPGQ